MKVPIRNNTEQSFSVYGGIMKSRHYESDNLTFANISRRSVMKMIAFGLSFSVIAPTLANTSAYTAETAGKKPLIVYFSMPETDNPQNMTREEENSTVVIDGKVLGNTQYVAQLIQEMTDGDIFRILPQKPYPTDHRTLVDLAKEEQEQDARPAIAGKLEALEAYDTIFIGYPNWWGDMPMILYTFLEQYDFSGKTLIPFCTHGGSGFSRTIQTIQDKQPDATVIRNGYSLSRSRMERAPSGVAEWLKEIGLKK